jgi:hypothetical protein
MTPLPRPYAAQAQAQVRNVFSAERFLCLSINKRFRDRPPQQILKFHIPMKN